MLRQLLHTPSRKLLFGTIIAGFTLVTLLCRFDAPAAPGCNILDCQGWVVLAVLRPIFLTGLYSLHLLEDSALSACLSQIVSFVGPFLCALAGPA